MSRWLMPHKKQVLVLMLARLTDSLAAHSIHSYMFFQVRHFNPTAPASVITTQCGLLVGAKTGAHVCTGLLWGRAADRILKSRKIVLVFGLLASSVTTVAYGFSTSFRQAIFWQVLDGALNATVAMIRCMVAELQPEEQHRVRAFTLLPLFANVGAVIGPLIGGFLSSVDPERSIIPGYPYAMPNLCVAVIETLVAVAVILYLTDVFHDTQAKTINTPDTSREIDPAASHGVASEEVVDETTALLGSNPSTVIETESRSQPEPSRPLVAKEIWTPNVLRTMFAQFIIAGHLGTFSTLWTMLLSLPVATSRTQHLPFQFSGGLGLRPHLVGIIMSSFGVAGIILQVMVYPSLQGRWGTISVWRAALYLFPVVYAVAPFCALLAWLEKVSGPQHAAAYSLVKWTSLLGVLVAFSAGRTGVVPATSLLINDCTPHPTVRGSIHTTGVVCSNLSKAFFPPLALAVMGSGLQVGVVGLGFWFVAVLAICSIVASAQVSAKNDQGLHDISSRRNS